MDVALVTCLNLPKPDTDSGLLCEALAGGGLSARALAWDDPGVDWAEPRVCVIRSTWNYIQNYVAYMVWAKRCASVSRLWNPFSVLKWNSHKSYLLELEAQGLPIVPTRFVPKGVQSPSLAAAATDWAAVVIKPAVSAGSFATMRCERTRFPDGQAHLEKMVATHDMLVQRYVPSVEGHGERAVVWIDGAITHAVRKAPRFIGDSEQVSEGVDVSREERDVALKVMAAAPRPLLYARIDLVNDDDGRPLLMELELIEPSLFLDRSPDALERLAASVARLL